ncbi:hypothetical protein JEQ07_20180 [Serratia proteamaculans]|uniref:Uncharacterized protein n=1 Tax=Serratia proteamaculans TaxID=28151 RepID=A0ABS0TWG0_SERPR|nr:hypothetical protein [Serratia proteamaculans]MBI6182703.1 hypothetical protein [Serratia proteamaculans]
MNWQGIPFKFFGEEPLLQQAFLSVSHLPNIVVKSDFALDTFLSGLFAGIIPAVVAVWAMRSNAKNMQDERMHQLEMAGKNITAQIVAASRQGWINELRDAGANYIGLVSAVTNCLNIMLEEHLANRSGSEMYLRMHEEQRKLKRELGLLKTKIELLLNPNEPDSQEVILALEKIRRILISKNKPRDKRIDFDDLRPLYTELRLSIYTIVKNEWNKLKGL